MRSLAIRAVARRKVGGFATIALALAVVIVTALLVSGIYLKQMRGQETLLEKSQSAALNAARESIEGFAMVNNRLPCPALQRAGTEDCSVAKGWLPVQTLLSDPDPQSLLNSAAVRYVVYRGVGGIGGGAGGSGLSSTGNVGSTVSEIESADGDLAATKDTYVPRAIDGTPAYTSPTIINSLDLCESLRLIAPNEIPLNIWLPSESTNTTARRTDRAYVTGVDGVRNIAYGIAVAASGAAQSLSGVNADFSTVQMEDPARPQSAQYADIVQIARADSLYERMSCGATAGALDTAAIASTWSPDAVASKEGAVKAFKRVVRIEGLMVTAASLGVTGDTGSILNLYTSLIESAILAIVGPTPEQIVTGTAGVAEASAGLGQAYKSLAVDIANVAVESANLIGYRLKQDQMASMYVWNASADHLTNIDRAGVSP